MRIKDVINNLTALYEADDKNPAADLAKGKSKVQGSSKRAGHKGGAEQKGGAVTDLVKGGKGQGQEGGQAKRAANQKVKKGEFDAERAETAKSERTKGALDPMRARGEGEAAAASRDWESDVGEIDRGGANRDAKKALPKDTRQRFSADSRRNDAGLDYSQTAAGRAPREEEEDDKVTSEKDRIYTDAEIAELRASSDKFDQEIAAGMERHNATVQKTKAAASPELTDAGKAAEKQLAMQKKAAKDELDARKEQTPDHIAQALAKKEERKKRNQETSGDWSREETEIAATTGSKRGSLEVGDMIRKAKEKGWAQMSAEEVNDAAVRAGEGDVEAQEAIFGKTALLLFHLARKYGFGDSEKVADMYGEAKAALMQSMQTFDPSKGAGFSTWLYKNVDGLVKNAAYADKNIRVPQHKADEVGKMKEIQAKLEHEGITGVDADLEVINQMGLKSWDDLDKLKQLAQGTGSLNAPMGGEEGEEGMEVGDTVGDSGIESDYHGSGTDDVEMSNLQKELATSGDQASLDVISGMYDRAGVDPQARQLLNSMFGMGGEEPMTDQEVQAAFGVTNYQIKKILEPAIMDIALTIAEENGTDPDHEAANIAKILKGRKLDYKASQMGRDYMGSTDPDERTPEQRAEDEALAKERYTVRNQRKRTKPTSSEPKARKPRGKERQTGSSAMRDAMNAARGE